MATTNEIRNRLIESLMAINDLDYLKALESLIKSSNVGHSKISLTEEQKIMLAMSDEDIIKGRVLEGSQEPPKSTQKYILVGISRCTQQPLTKEPLCQWSLHPKNTLMVWYFLPVELLCSEEQLGENQDKEEMWAQANRYDYNY